METEEQYRIRTSQNCERTRRARAKLTDPQVDQINICNAYKMAVMRKKETPQQRSLRNASNATKMSNARSLETPDQRQLRNVNNAANQSARRKMETPEQRQLRNSKNASNTLIARDAETPQQRTLRNASKQNDRVRRSKRKKEEVESYNLSLRADDMSLRELYLNRRISIKGSFTIL